MDYNKSKKPVPNCSGSLFTPPEVIEKDNHAMASKMDKSLHDFRSSINIIVGYSELLLDGVLGKMTEEQRDAISDILTSSQHMLHIVNEIHARQIPARR